MVKLNRTYVLSIETRDGRTLEITPPLTLEFDVTRKNFGAATLSTFTIYNLNEAHRNNIRFDQFDSGKLRKISLKAGYVGSYGALISLPGQLSTLFDGNISRAYSIRSGVNFLTKIEAYDAGFASVNATSNLAVPAGTPLLGVISGLMLDLKKYDVTPGAIGSGYTAPLTRGNSYEGSTVDLLSTLTGNGFYIDNGIARVLGDNEYVLGQLPIIDANTGLLGTPYLENTFLSFDMLFEPRLIVGQQVFLKSTTSVDQITNRQYKVIGLHHHGVISGAVSGDAITTLSCLYGPKGLNLVPGI